MRNQNNFSYSLKNHRGQVSLLFAIVIIVGVTLIAFVINIGLFVKAKINLQNAVDAAAWSGAAVQARQLTDIGYLNWEMRNNYKEWLFKYYVLGNLSTRGVQNPGSQGNQHNVGQGNMDFTVGPNNSDDLYNIPSICMHLYGQIDLCAAYKLTGMPRLSAPGFSNLDEITSGVVDSISEQKAKDCSVRSDLNFRVAMLWTYGTGDTVSSNSIASNAPQVVANRTGAWPRAIELALRIRNLESIVNTPAAQPICANGGAPGCSLDINTLNSANKIHNERTVKAFYAAYRNLGNQDDAELKASFVLTEIPPLPLDDTDTQSLSNLFYPAPAPKYFLDLRLSIINYAIFYTMMTSRSEEASNNNEAGIDATCQMTKVALPVPGFPFGYDKNPDLLTYYAVKGEAEFVGLFNPFTKPIKLTAFASAKPFGARIGPKIFDTVSNPKHIVSRSDPNKYRSTPYIFGLNLTSNVNVLENFPIIPMVQDFWVEDENDVIGGNEDPDKIKFVIPNLVYDPEDISSGNVYGGDKIYVMDIPHQNSSQALNKGIFDIDQFTKFRDNTAAITALTANNITEAIENVRAPTLYEAKNYLIPTSHAINNVLKLDSFGQPATYLNVFAPLFGPEYLYTSAEQIKEIVKTFLTTQEPSIIKYVNSLDEVASQVRAQTSASTYSTGSTEIYTGAANIIHDGPNGITPTCNSIAGRFLYFYLGDDSSVPISPKCMAPLYDEFEDYLIDTQRVNPLVYTAKLKNKDTDLNTLRQYFTAYKPGPLSGGNLSPDGEIENPFLQGAVSYSLRNFYSTKLISLRSVIDGALTNATNASHLYSEGSQAQSVNGAGIKNILQINQVTSMPLENIYQ
jgi:uncharacterized protein (UPF0333 family)